MANELLNQQLQDQLQGNDPFSQARLQSQQPLASAQFVGDPFSPQGQAPVQNNTNPMQNTGTQFKSLYQDPTQGQTMDAKLMASIQKLGIDSKGISINPLGKFSLMNKFKDKFGLDFQNNKDVKQVLGDFDKAISFYSDESSKSMIEANNKAQRTLAALKGIV